MLLPTTVVLLKITYSAHVLMLTYMSTLCDLVAYGALYSLRGDSLA